ncbi:AgrD family cyclic lactone autoinducer peptide [Paenibacillus sp. NPDC056579]
MILNTALVGVAFFTVPTSFSFEWHRPEVPQELKK